MKLEEYNGVIGKIIENGEKLQCIEKDIQAIKSRIQRMESCVNLYSDYSSKIMDPAILVLINSGLCAKNMRHAQSELHLKELHNTKDALLAENEVLFEKALGMIRDEQSSKVQTITKSEVVSKIDTITINLLHIDDLYSEKRGKSNQSLLSLINKMIELRNEID